jgi:hypothetical protein
MMRHKGDAIWTLSLPKIHFQYIFYTEWFEKNPKNQEIGFESDMI